MQQSQAALPPWQPLSPPGCTASLGWSLACPPGTGSSPAGREQRHRDGISTEKLHNSNRKGCGACGGDWEFPGPRDTRLLQHSPGTWMTTPITGRFRVWPGTGGGHWSISLHTEGHRQGESFT